MDYTQNLPFEATDKNHDLEAMLEAMIFVSKEAVTAEQLTETLVQSEIEISLSEVKKALSSLLTKWEDKARQQGRGIILHKIAGGYLFASAQEFSFLTKKLTSLKPIELTKAQIEVLSIIAYRQPITRVDVDDIRGVDSSFAIKRLMQLKLLKILGKSEGLGRPLLYGTTKHFLEFFSLNSLHDLPTLKQFDSLGRGEEMENIDLNNEQVSLKDLFLDSNSPMFSQDVERQSDEALKSLDEALLRIDGVSKNSVSE